MTGIQSLRWMGTMVLVAMCAGSAAGQQRGQGGPRVMMDRPAMTATGAPTEGGSRSSGVSGPSLGYAWDAATGDIHMVSGIAGSSLSGMAVHRKAPLRLAAISPDGAYAVVVDETDAAVFYGDPGARNSGGVSLWDNPSVVTHAAVSPRGDRFALYAAASGRMAVYSVRDGSPGVPVVFQASVPPQSVARMALSDAGEGVLVIAGSGAGTSVFKINADGDVRSLAALPGALDLAFFAGSERALVLDGAQNALYEADFAMANPTLRLIASQAEGIQQPLAMALSGDGRSVVIASAARKEAVVVDLTSRASERIALAETPTGIRRMHARGVFQLTDARTSPMLLLELQPEGSRTVYVPRAGSGRGASRIPAGLR